MKNKLTDWLVNYQPPLFFFKGEEDRRTDVPAFSGPLPLRHTPGQASWCLSVSHSRGSYSHLFWFTYWHLIVQINFMVPWLWSAFVNPLLCLFVVYLQCCVFNLLYISMFCCLMLEVCCCPLRINNVLLIQVKNLRSGVSRVAVCTLGDLYSHLQKAMDQELEGTVKALLQKAGESNAFIRQDVDAALDCMVQHCTPTRGINALLSGGLRSVYTDHIHTQ